YAAQVPDTFRFLVKAHELCTVPRFGRQNRYNAVPGDANPQFLDPVYAAEQVIAPAVDGLKHKPGPIVFQFTPLQLQYIGGADRLIDRIGAFLAALPRGPLYAVELRNRDLLTTRYIAALQAADGIYCFNVHPKMPPLGEQAKLFDGAAQRAVVVRWMLGGRQEYEEAKDRYAPFDKLVDEDPVSRNAIAALALSAIAAKTPVYTIANNKAEGCAPRTVFKLAERIVQG